MAESKITAELYEFIAKVVEDKVREIKVTREEFDRLVAAVDRLAEAQAKTEERVNQLAEAQRRTEERLNKLTERVDRLAESVERLAEAQRRTEERLNRLTERVDRLAEAQAKTEERVSRLEERVDRLAESVERLAEAQRRTEERVNQLADSVDKLAKAVDGLRLEVGRLSETVGFGLEDIARVVLPGWLHRHLGVEVELERGFVVVEGREVEVDLYGEGRREGREVVVLGEVKSRIYGRDVERFYEGVYRPVAESIGREVVGVLFGYLIHPSAQRRAEELGLHVVASYQR